MTDIILTGKKAADILTSMLIFCCKKLVESKIEIVQLFISRFA